MKDINVSEIQSKLEIIKAKFLELANEFEAETGLHLHLSVHHAYKGEGSEILTCEVKVPEVSK